MWQQGLTLAILLQPSPSIGWGPHADRNSLISPLVIVKYSWHRKGRITDSFPIIAISKMSCSPKHLWYLPKMIKEIFITIEITQLNKFGVFQSTILIIPIDAPIVPSVGSGSLFRLAPESFGRTLIAFKRVFAFWWERNILGSPCIFSQRSTVVFWWPVVFKDQNLGTWGNLHYWVSPCFWTFPWTELENVFLFLK